MLLVRVFTQADCFFRNRLLMLRWQHLYRSTHDQQHLPRPLPRSRAVWCGNSGDYPCIPTPLLGSSSWNRRTSDSRVGDQVSLQRWDLCGLFPAKPLSCSGLLPGVGQAQAEVGVGVRRPWSTVSGPCWPGWQALWSQLRPGCSALETPQRDKIQGHLRT